ncbi:MAG: ribonuclease Z [Candidatus Kapaibacterium sp.]
MILSSGFFVLSMKIIPLGTKAGGSAHIHRYPSSYYFSFENEHCLIDAGEGVQFQLLRSGLSAHALKNIFITHLHGDHVLGLMGVLSNLSSEHRTNKLSIYGPKGLRELIEVLCRLTHVEFRYNCDIYELEEAFQGVFYTSNCITVEALPMEHRIPCFGYKITELVRENIDIDKARALGVIQPEHFKRLKEERFCTINSTNITLEEILLPKVTPRKVVFCGDTRPCTNAVSIAQDCDVLIYESTFADNLKTKAHERYHSTAKQAAEVARQANVMLLYLTHISNRYDDATPLVEEARTIFPNTYLCKELEEIIIPKHSM